MLGGYWGQGEMLPQRVFFLNFKFLGYFCPKMVKSDENNKKYTGG